MVSWYSPVAPLASANRLIAARNFAERRGHAVIAHEQPRHLHVLLVVELVGGQGGVNEPIEQLGHVRASPSGDAHPSAVSVRPNTLRSSATFAQRRLRKRRLAFEGVQHDALE